jgi:hypothetical protein
MRLGFICRYGGMTANKIISKAIVNQNVEEDVLSLKQEVSKLQQQLHQLKNRLKGGSKGKAVSEGMTSGDAQG